MSTALAVVTNASVGPILRCRCASCRSHMPRSKTNTVPAVVYPRYLTNTRTKTRTTRTTGNQVGDKPSQDIHRGRQGHRADYGVRQACEMCTAKGRAGHTLSGVGSVVGEDGVEDHVHDEDSQ